MTQKLHPPELPAEGEKSQMTKLIIKTGTEEDFFKRGLKLARAADRGEPLRGERIVSFEDSADEEAFRVKHASTPTKHN